MFWKICWNGISFWDISQLLNLSVSKHLFWTLWITTKILVLKMNSFLIYAQNIFQNIFQNNFQNNFQNIFFPCELGPCVFGFLLQQLPCRATVCVCNAHMVDIKFESSFLLHWIRVFSTQHKNWNSKCILWRILITLSSHCDASFFLLILFSIQKWSFQYHNDTVNEGYWIDLLGGHDLKPPSPPLPSSYRWANIATADDSRNETRAL